MAPGRGGEGMGGAAEEEVGAGRAHPGPAAL